MHGIESGRKSSEEKNDTIKSILLMQTKIEFMNENKTKPVCLWANSTGYYTRTRTW